MKTTNLLASSAVAAALLASLVPATAQARNHGHHGQRPITVYFTRHAEKKTTTTVRDDIDSLGYELAYSGDEGTASANGQTPVGKSENRDDVCGAKKCAEELNAFGLERAELLADWFERNRITRRVDAVISSHKRRTFQTVDPIAVDAGLTVQQFPIGGTELEPEGTTASECPTVEAILSADPGDTLVVAGHSGTLYDIMGSTVEDCSVSGLGLDISSDRRFPKDTGKNEGKVRDFGDIWKVVIYPQANGEFTTRFAYRVNLQPKRLSVSNYSY